jgi:hypothetical protein
LGSDPVVAEPRPLAIGRSPRAVRTGALTLTRCKLRLAQHIKQKRGAIMQSGGGVVDPCCV